MDIFERPYYRLNNRLLTLLGLWPYQDRKTRLFRGWCVSVIIVIFILIMFFQLCTCNGNFDILIDAGTIMMVAFNVAMKYYTYRSGMLNMRTLLDSMIIDWKMWTSKEEIEILEKYAMKGRFYTLAYAAYLYVATLLFVSLPFISPVMDIIAPLNESRPMELPVMAEYFISQEDYYSLLYCHATLSMFLGMTIFVAADTQFFVFTCHLCSIFTIVGHRLERLSKDESITGTLSSYRQEDCFKNVARSIRGHKRAIEFAKIIESSFSYPLLIQCGINITDLSITLYRLTSLKNMYHGLDLFLLTLQITALLSFSAEVVRYIAFLIGQLFHIFCITYFGQQIIDHSSKTFIKAYSGPWYDKPLRISRMLILVMRNSYKPVQLTAGKIFIFSLEGFATIVQTSTSYFMVLLSMR